MAVSASSAYAVWSVRAVICQRIHFVESVFSTSRRYPLTALLEPSNVASAALISTAFASVLLMYAAVAAFCVDALRRRNPEPGSAFVVLDENCSSNVTAPPYAPLGPVGPAPPTPPLNPAATTPA